MRSLVGRRYLPHQIWSWFPPSYVEGGAGGSSSIKGSLFTPDRERKSASEEKTLQHTSGVITGPPSCQETPTFLQRYKATHTRTRYMHPNPLPEMTQHMQQINALHFLLTFDPPLPAASPKSRKKVTESQTEAGRRRKSRLFLLSCSLALSH